MTILTGWPDFQPRVSPAAQDDLLYENLSVPTPAWPTITVTLEAAYEGILVIAESPGANQWQITPNWTGSGIVKEQIFGITAGSPVADQFFFPVRNRVGDVLKVPATITFTMLGGSIFVYGLRALPPLLLRSDGRVHPRGDSISFVVPGAGSATLVAAPASPSRVLLKSISASCPAAGAFVQIFATVGGVNTNLLTAWGPVGLVLPWESGLLCDPATLVGAAGNNAQTYAHAVYDIVV